MVLKSVNHVVNIVSHQWSKLFRQSLKKTPQIFTPPKKLKIAENIDEEKIENTVYNTVQYENTGTSLWRT